LGVEGLFARMDGRMGFEQITGQDETLNDLQDDLGLPAERRNFTLSMTVRPLEHHVLRVYGSVPEFYAGSNTLTRRLVTRNGVYSPGETVESQMRRWSFGFGYDLDFVVGPRWYAGLNGDLRYIGMTLRMKGAGVGLEDTMAVEEVVPCLGAHAETKLRRIVYGTRASLGGFGRMTFGRMPNFVNYVEISVGGSVELGTGFGPLVKAKLGYKHEGFFNDQEVSSGRVLETSSDGILFSIEGAF